MHIHLEANGDGHPAIFCLIQASAHGYKIQLLCRYGGLSKVDILFNTTNQDEAIVLTFDDLRDKSKMRWVHMELASDAYVSHSSPSLIGVIDRYIFNQTRA